MSIIPLSIWYNFVVSKVNKKDKNLGSMLMNFLLGMLLLCFLFIPGYLFYTSFVNEDGSLPTASEIIETINNQNSPNISSADWDTSNTKDQDIDNIYEENPVLGENFFEKFPTINDEQAYVSIPMRVDTLTPPPIVIYSHGSNETVGNEINNDFMKKLRLYSLKFTSNNFIFAASNQHGQNWGDVNSVADTKALIDWIRVNYTASNDIYLVGFSMGGLPTMSFTLEYPEDIKAIALLAPSLYSNIGWSKTDINVIADIPIKIWHGTADANISIIHSYTFVNMLAEYGKDVELKEKEGKTHFDVDDEYLSEILEFFESTLQE